MREILFRSKRKDNGEWVYGYYCRYGYVTQEKTFIIPDYASALYATEVIPETVGQYTGLTDKNSKRIFEGDIIRYADMYDYNCWLEGLDENGCYDKWDFGNIWTIDKVVYAGEEGYPAFDLYSHQFEANGLSEVSESSNYFYEVIGNIHDNPELLKEQDK